MALSSSLNSLEPSSRENGTDVPEKQSSSNASAVALASSPDNEQVRKCLLEFEARWPSETRRLAHDGERLSWLTLVFSSSRFLTEEILKRRAWISEVDRIAHSLSRDEYSDRLAAFLRQLAVDRPGAGELALFRRKELLRILIRDQGGIADLPEICAELSNLADAILGCALSLVTADLEQRWGTPVGEDGQKGQFAVIALGKLGGRELNYSSDIDLMFLYSANGETNGAQPLTNREFFKKVANQLTNLLSTYTPAGLCYRVDLRLRPEGSHGEICLPLSAAKEYYRKRARDWELQMLLKARTAAGDEQLGGDLLHTVEPLIYSTSLDFSTIETMSAARQRMGERFARKPLRPSEVNVKLTRGGIRDIEFLVQCLQRLHGNRERAVKETGTLEALARLHDKDLLSATEFSRLGNAYRFLRRLEHVLQFESDRQTHTLPGDGAELERIASCFFRGGPQSSGEQPAALQLRRELNRHLENVQAIYERIVHAQRPLYYSSQPVSGSFWDAASETDERADVCSHDEIARRFEHQSPALAHRIRLLSTCSFRNGFSDFLEKLLDHPAELALFSQNSTVSTWTAQIFDSSPVMAAQLFRYPELVNEVRRAADYPGRRYAFEGLAAPLNDIEGLRRFFRQEMFRIQVGSICLPEPVFQTLDQTSALAEFVIARAYRIALEMGLAHARQHATAKKPFEEPKGEMMIVALGRLGMREFDLGSDADLLFIIPEAESVRQRFWTRVVERLLEILSAYSEGGPILSIDTRLRPNGREGMLVQSESKYVEYFSNHAEAWEGIAYMKARGVAGDTDRATRFLSELQQVDWRRYGQGGRSRAELRQMRLRLQKEQGVSAPLKAGQGGYYDADFILMYLRLRGAGMFFKSLNTPERVDILEKMGHLERVDAEFLLESTTYFRALDHALRLVTGHAEGKVPAAADQQQMIAQLMNRWTTQQSAAETLRPNLLAAQSRMHRLFEAVFSQ